MDSAGEAAPRRRRREGDDHGKLSDRYPFPAPEGKAIWHVPQNFDVVLQLGLRRRARNHDEPLPQGVEMQWDAETRNRLDPGTRRGEIPSSCLKRCCRSPVWRNTKKMSAKEKATVRRPLPVGWQISQFMQGEQGALTLLPRHSPSDQVYRRASDRRAEFLQQRCSSPHGAPVDPTWVRG